MYPILFKTNGLTIYAYGSILALGLIVGGVLILLKARKVGIPFERVIELFFIVILSAIVGSRGLYILFLLWMKKRKSFDGQVFWSFILLYSYARFGIEFFRDDPRGFLLKILSTSQAMGILLAILSFYMLFYLKRR